MAELESQSVGRPATTSTTWRPDVPPAPRRTAPLLVKHALDRVIAASGLIVTAPLLAAVALGLRHATGRVLRRDHRLAEDGRLIVVRSFAITEDLRLRSRVWCIAASAGLAALPQLWSVLRGDMSVIGPRPREPGLTPPPMRPGLTGPAQLEQLRRWLPVAEQRELDADYARTWSLALDARIVWRTLWVVLG